MENLKSIKKYHLFKGIEEQDISAILHCLSAKFLTIKKNETFIHKGDRIDFLYVITSGIARENVIDYDGNINTHIDFHDGDIIGLESFLNNRKYFTSDIVAVSEVTVILISSFRFTNPCSNFCPRHTKILLNAFSLLAKQNNRLSDRIKELTMHSTKEKILAYLSNLKALNHSSSFDIPYTHQDLASHLGLERSALSKELSDLQKDGKIEYKGKHFKINI